jgi:type II secretory ATPase GspE/PulE/Tfp pilus assembly ATPase PilB-like protein
MATIDEHCPLVVFSGETSEVLSATITPLMSYAVNTGNRVKILDEEPDGGPFIITEGFDIDEVHKHFVNEFRWAVRLDSDIIMAGDIERCGTVSEAARWVGSGHQVHCVVRVSSAFEIPAKLSQIGMSVEKINTIGHQSIFVSQTSVSRLCDQCSIPLVDAPSSGKHSDLAYRINHALPGKDLSKVRFRNTAGCPDCNAGVNGHTIVYEVITPTPDMISCLLSGDLEQAKQMHLNSGGMLKLHAGIEVMLTGIVDALEIESKIGAFKK